MRMRVDEPGAHHQAGGVEHRRRIVVDRAHGRDATVLHADVTAIPRCTGAVDDRRSADEVVEHSVDTTAVKYGVTMFATDRTMPVHELAKAAEERGFDSVYVPEHTHIPVSRETPPATGTDELDDGYMRT